MNGQTARLFLALALTLAARGTEIFVSPNGNDAWSGRRAAADPARTDGPFATLERARDEIRGLRDENGDLAEPVTVTLRRGTYALARTFVLTPADSGSEACPIAYRAAPGEAVLLVGAKPVRAWRPAADGLCVASLRDQGFQFLGFHQLFCEGQRQTLARHPNRDPAHPHTGGLLYVDAPSQEPKRGLHYAPGEIPLESWDDVDQAEINIFPYNCWDHNITRVRRFDSATRHIRLRYPVAGRINEGNRYFVQNVRGALDAPGEWYLDRTTGELSFLPPRGSVSDGDVVLPVVENLIELQGTEKNAVRHVIIRGLQLLYAEQDGIAMEGAEHCQVIGCTVRNVGGVGVNAGFVRNASRGIGNAWRRGPRRRTRVHSGDRSLLRGVPCANCRIAGNDIDSVGGDGLILAGNENTADNNHISRVGLYDMVCAGITVGGDANRVSHNEIHDVPRDGVFVNGARNVLEYNTIRNSMLYTADNSAIALRQHNVERAVRDIGNVIRFNRILDTIGYGSNPHCGHPPKGFASPFASWGIYLDGSICGVTVYGNVIARSGANSIFVQFGGGNVVENNICVEPAQNVTQYCSVLFFGWFMHSDRDNRFAQPPNQFRHNIFYYSGGERKLYTTGLWGHPEAHPDQAVFDHNLIWSNGEPITVEMDPRHRYNSLQEWRTGSGHDHHSIVADPLFVDMPHDDYRLRPESPAYTVGFRDINAELSRAGAYESDERARWPLTGLILEREDPLVFEYHKPPKPLVDGFELAADGSLPGRGKVNDEGKGLLVVSDETSRTGRHALRFTDAAELEHVFNPHVEYRLPYPTGRLRFSVDIMNSAEGPADWYMEFRDWRGELRVGPTVRGTPDGTLAVGGKFGTGGRPIASIPPGTWFTVGLDFATGEEAGKTYTLTLDVPGQDQQVLDDLPFVDRTFEQLTWFGISSMSARSSVFFVDNLILGSADSPDVEQAMAAPAVRGLPETVDVVPDIRHPERLVLHWTFDEGGGDAVPDHSGHGLDGERAGGAWVRGAFGSAFLLDGAEGAIEVQDDPVLELDTSDFTIACWLFPTELNIDSQHQRRRILDKGLCPAVWWNLDVLCNGKLRMEMGAPSRQNATTDSEGAIPEGQWTHLAVVVDRAAFTTTYYLNGTLDSVRPLPRTFTGSLRTDGKSLTTGIWQPYLGLIDDLRLYRRALSPDEVNAQHAETGTRYADAAFQIVEE